MASSVLHRPIATLDPGADDASQLLVEFCIGGWVVSGAFEFLVEGGFDDGLDLAGEETEWGGRYISSFSGYSW